jgi:hypothetical protein
MHRLGPGTISLRRIGTKRFIGSMDKRRKRVKTDQRVGTDAKKTDNTYGEVEIIWYHRLLSSQNTRTSAAAAMRGRAHASGHAQVDG